MKLGMSVRIKEDSYFIKERYLKYFSDYEIVFINPYSNMRAYEECVGFVVIGGADLNPSLYNEENYASTDICDEMDQLDFKIIDYAVKSNKPLFGICRGLQAINVFFKGSLKQHIFNHNDGYHKIVLVEDYLDFPNSDEVNTLHHQSIKKLGDNLKPLYYSLDGEVECLIHETLPIIASQFHPEMNGESSFSQLLLEYFKSLISINK